MPRRQEPLIKRDQQGAILSIRSADVGRGMQLALSVVHVNSQQATYQLYCPTYREDVASKVFNPKEGAEKFTFQAEVNRLMDIIIHSLYSNKVSSQRKGTCYSSKSISLIVVFLPHHAIS